MSTSRHHIPFPKTFLTVNTPVKKSGSVPGTASSSPPTQSVVPAHGFLSNLASRPATLPRHSSISSVNSASSVDSTASSTASAPNANGIAASPFAKQASHGFLSLNAKYAAPPTSAQAIKEAEKHGFLSNQV
ncbi:hypothetical protein CC80DRAFT_510338 [Byssothecium circinans]|uniref:Uncharacterized protein n=1 Tax=Byssothecium circinans TaxID=147558 RepID=A0A6A5T9T5_9PLEO|nr:hypothetical protein CC80DRAFT_510338 [Byssothecium circinans]